MNAIDNGLGRYSFVFDHETTSLITFAYAVWLYL